MKRILLSLVVLGFLGSAAFWLGHGAAQLESAGQPTQAAQPAAAEPSPQRVATESSTALAAVAPEQNARIEQRERAAAEILSLLSCDETDSCPQDNSDPRAGFFLQGEMLIAQLRDFDREFAGTAGFDAQLAELIAELLAHKNGHVQAEAVDFMAQQEPNRRSAQALISALVDTADGKLFAKALPELARYPSLETEVRDLYEYTLRSGSLSASRALAQNLGPYLNQGNIGFYSALAQQLPGQAAKTRYLKATLEAYERRE
ncbi:hypothetical protein [Microbulbifer hydrolyticus]|uniref:Uncharacterized protein n=1 Tax=Microbulbifer hydrolyticus TaxID=48074 RepID=A0A6P1T8T6_9GAMM|nr:hypothetical protein [Microbulbifer hydrolyticus]MBB5211059.1 hypothetical protein [Microbulbifer hydrolyticus]QHQ38145.1 hypothetical protein GTQ55_03465 [Microbulbifer hydrolyticus]